MKQEAKVAWPKSHPINAALQSALRGGRDLAHEQLIEAVDDPDGQRVFEGHRLVRPTGPETHKREFVVLQYSVYLRDEAGRVACFRRAPEEARQDRITWGASLLLSASTPIDPRLAVQKTLRDTICVSSKRRIGPTTPRGTLWNPLPPDGEGDRPTYLIEIHEHVLPAGTRLFGRWKHSPDSFVDWAEPQDLPNLLERSGYADQTLGAALASGTFDPVDEGPGELIYSPSTRILGSETAPVRREEYSSGFNVFISHAGEDTFAAYALHRLLVDESSRSIYPTVDLDDLPDGERLSKIDRLIEAADALVVVVTPILLEKSRGRAATGEKDWVRSEVELALSLNKPVFAFKLGTLDSPPYLPEGLVANKKALYADWQREVQRLVESVQRRFGP
jgi:hypothetical protein